MFDIRLTSNDAREMTFGADKAVNGVIQLSAAIEESFVSVLDFWSPERYLEHWIAALMRCAQGSASSALVTSFFPPSPGGHLVWWPLYRDARTVHIQNHLLLFDQLEKPFDEANPWASVRPRRTKNDEGLPISEWDVPLSDVEICLERLKVRVT